MLSKLCGEKAVCEKGKRTERKGEGEFNYCPHKQPAPPNSPSAEDAAGSAQSARSRHRSECPSTPASQREKFRCRSPTLAAHLCTSGPTPNSEAARAAT